eukprot:RCo044420
MSVPSALRKRGSARRKSVREVAEESAAVSAPAASVSESTARINAEVEWCLGIAQDDIPASHAAKQRDSSRSSRVPRAVISPECRVSPEQFDRDLAHINKLLSVLLQEGSRPDLAGQQNPSASFRSRASHENPRASSLAQIGKDAIAADTVVLEDLPQAVEDGNNTAEPPEVSVRPKVRRAIPSCDIVCRNIEAVSAGSSQREQERTSKLAKARQREWEVLQRRQDLERDHMRRMRKLEKKLTGPRVETELGQLLPQFAPSSTVRAQAWLTVVYSALGFFSWPKAPPRTGLSS